jgi:tetratricopeptide (TPR) repeat protein
MWNVGILTALLLMTAIQNHGRIRTGITIINTGKDSVGGRTFYDVGPEVGAILNNHYFPAINQFNAGRYVDAEDNLTYLVERPFYTDGNPRQAQFLSTAHYLRGIIYFYHASGVGRQSLAKGDFEAAIKWNPNNHLAYLELSRVYSSLQIRDYAISIIERLLELEPEANIAQQAKTELEKLKSTESK